MDSPPPHDPHLWFSCLRLCLIFCLFLGKNAVKTALEYKKLYYIILYKNTSVFMCILLLKLVSCGPIKF